MSRVEWEIMQGERQRETADLKAELEALKIRLDSSETARARLRSALIAVRAALLQGGGFPATVAALEDELRRSED
jgi:hypothetical protein